MSPFPTVSLDDVKAVSPALAHYTADALTQALWSRPGLSKRDRSLVTVAALIASERSIGFAHYFARALDCGVTPAELSEIVTQVAFYAGWSTAFSASLALKSLFEDRGIGTDQLPPVSPDLLPAGEALPGDAIRKAILEERFGGFVPGLVAVTNSLLYGEVWLRPGLSPRDRNLVTIVAFIAAGQMEFFGLYLDKAVRMGVTREEVAEAITHLAFYLGWPAALSAANAATAYFAAQAA